jgi:hypothetical protein
MTSARRETTLTSGSHLSAGEREGEVYRFEISLLGRGPRVVLGRNLSLGPFSLFLLFLYFYFPFFCFSFITFSI